MLGAHHKTGSVLAGDSVRCFDHLRDKVWRYQLHASKWPNSTGSMNISYANYLASKIPNVTTDTHWQGPVPEDTYVIHFVRNTAATVVSAYEYHKKVGETWTRVDGSAPEVLNTSGWFKRHIWQQESYTDFLRRVPMRVGLHAELFRLHREFNHMINASAWCSLTPHLCQEVCLEEFTSSSDSYKATWKRLLTFIGLTQKELYDPLMECLAHFDLHNETNRANERHVTNGTMTESEHQKVVDLEKLMDEKYFGGHVKRLSQKQYKCDARLRAKPKTQIKALHSSLQSVLGKLPALTRRTLSTKVVSSPTQWQIADQYA